MKMQEQSLTSPLYTQVFFLGFAYNFFLALHFTNNALYPLYVTHEGGGVALVGIFMGIYSLAAAAGRPFVGFLLERYGARNMLIIGSLALSLPAFGYMISIGRGLSAPVWILRIIQGFGYGAHFSATFLFAAQIAPHERRNESVAMYGASGLAGSMIGPYIGELLVEGPGLASFFCVMALFGLCASFIISRIPGGGKEGDIAPGRGSILSSFRSRPLRNVFLISFLLAICYSAPTTFLATLARERGIQQFSLYFTAWGIAGIIIRIIGGRWADRVGPRKVLIPGFLLYACGLVTIHISDALPGFILAGIMNGIAHGVSFPAVTSLGYSRAPDGATGSAMAFITGMMDAGTALTALVVGPLAELAGFGIVFPTAAAAAMTCLMIVVVSIPHRPVRIR